MEAQVKQEQQAEVEAGRRAAVREMTFTPGWSLFSADAEDALLEAMMAILATDPMDPSAPAKIAYWRGRVDAIKSVFLWEIDMTAENQEDREIKSQGFVQSIKHLMGKLIWRA